MTYYIHSEQQQQQKKTNFEEKNDHVVLVKSFVKKGKDLFSKISISPEPVFKYMGQQMSGPDSSSG